MRSAFLYILMFLVSLAFSPAFGAEITGKGCKEALSPIFSVNKDEKVLAALQKGNPFGASKEQLSDSDKFMNHLRDVPLSSYRKDSDEHSKEVNDYFGRVRASLKACHQKCEGLALNLPRMVSIARGNDAKKEVIEKLEKDEKDGLIPRIRCSQIESGYSLEHLETLKFVLDDSSKSTLVAKETNAAPAEEKKEETTAAAKPEKKEDAPKVAKKDPVEESQQDDFFNEYNSAAQTRTTSW